MKNAVSFEMAKALKSANFPEPKQLRAGQFLYVDDELCIIVGIDNDAQIYYAPFSDFWVDEDSKEYQNWGAVYEENPNDVFIDGRGLFAPTSADVLAALFPPENRMHVGAMDVVRMALEPDEAAKQWLIRNKKPEFV